MYPTRFGVHRITVNSPAKLSHMTSRVLKTLWNTIFTFLVSQIWQRLWRRNIDEHVRPKTLTNNLSLNWHFVFLVYKKRCIKSWICLDETAQDRSRKIWCYLWLMIWTPMELKRQKDKSNNLQCLDNIPIVNRSHMEMPGMPCVNLHREHMWTQQWALELALKCKTAFESTDTFGPELEL